MLPVPRNRQELSFGNAYPPNTSQGIRFNAQVAIPEGTSGRLIFVQHLNPKRKKYLSDGSESVIGIAGWQEDKRNPYPTQDEQPGVPITNPGPHSLPLQTSDTPGVRLFTLPSNATKVTVDNDRYEMYVMWEAKTNVPSSRVALGMIEWGWSGEAKKDPTGEWVKVSGSPSKPSDLICVKTIRQGNIPPEKCEVD